MQLAFIVHLLCAPGTAPSVRETGEQDTYLPPSLTQVGWARGAEEVLSGKGKYGRHTESGRGLGN